MGQTVKERLNAYLRHKGVNKSEFGRKIGVSSSFVSSMRKSIQPDKVEKISASFPDLNVEWLMTGEGSMLRSQQGISQTLENVSKSVVGSRNRVVYGVDSSDGDCDWKARYEELEKRYNQLLEILGGK